MRAFLLALAGLFVSASLWAGQPGFADRAEKGAVRSATLTGDETYDASNKKFNKLDPGGASRNITLPAEGNAQGLWYVFTNTADASENLVIKEDGGSTVSTIAQGQTALVACDGTTWYEQTKFPSVANDGVTQWAEVSLTNAQVLALRATPITLVAAPGAGKVAELIGGVLIFDYTGAYTESADNLGVKYENGSGVQASTTIEATGFVDATADTATTFIGKTDTIVAKTGCENKALVLHNLGDDEYGGGNAANVLRVKVAYRVWTTGW